MRNPYSVIGSPSSSKNPNRNPQNIRYPIIGYVRSDSSPIGTTVNPQSLIPAFTNLSLSSSSSSSPVAANSADQLSSVLTWEQLNSHSNITIDQTHLNPGSINESPVPYNRLSATERCRLIGRLFHNHRHVGVSLSDLRGKIMSYAKDQTMCRVLQDKFDFPNQEQIKMVISEVIEHLPDLMTDQYGNHFFQKLIKVCNEYEQSRIITKLCSSSPVQLVIICQNLYGSRSVQKMLDFVTNPYHISLITSSLAHWTLDLATNPHGHHVLQQCFKLFSNEYNGNLIRAMADNCYQIATNRSGCVVLHTCVDKCLGEYKGILLSKIIGNSLHLAENPYGNYVVQHILDLRIPQVNECILNQLRGSFFTLSRSKFASNVVQKCLSETEPAQAEEVIIELISNRDIPILLIDPYGNFVIQSAYGASRGHVRAHFLRIINHHYPVLRTNPYGKKILQMLGRK